MLYYYHLNCKTQGEMVLQNWTEHVRVRLPWNNWVDIKVVRRGQRFRAADALEQVTQQAAAPVELLNDLWLFWAVPMQDVKPEPRCEESRERQESSPVKQIFQKTVAKITLKFHWRENYRHAPIR